MSAAANPSSAAEGDAGAAPRVRYGAHSIMFTETWTDGHLNVLDTVRELGAEVFEISVGDELDISPYLVRRRAESLGLALTVGPGGVWPMDCDLSSDDPAERARGLSWHCRIVDLAAEFGAFAYCGAAYGHPGTVKRRVPPPDELSHIAEGLHKLAEYAERAGVMVSVEPMSHFRTHVANNAEQLTRIIEAADHPNLRAVLDTYHMITEERDYDAAIRRCGPHLMGIHACENDRGRPGGGLVPWDDVFSALLDIGFDGFLMLEAYNSASDFAVKRGMFHDVCPDPVEFIREGFAFLQNGMVRARNSRPSRPGSATDPS